VKPYKREQKRGIGLYTYEQAKNTTPFQRFAQVTVGTVFVLLGMMLGYDQYESLARRSTEGLISAAALIVIGIFLAHAGAIFWYRRLRKRSN
jgi:NhaP-type Na+/H+ or K+/H+ antiporter